jgi:lipoprotein-releasing system permease protein
MSRLPFELLLALRYLRPKRTFVSIITLISIMGVMLGVAVLIIVISVMSGFDHDLRDKILGFNGHLKIYQIDPAARSRGHVLLEDYAQVTQIVNSNQNVTGSAPLAICPVGLETERPGGDQQFLYPEMRGIDPATETNTSLITTNIIDGRNDLSSDGLLAGADFAESLGLRVGDRVAIYSQPDIEAMWKSRDSNGVQEVIPPKDYEVRGIFQTGYNEYDANVVVVSLANFQDLFHWDDDVAGVVVMLKDPEQANRVRAELQPALGPGYEISTWREEGNMMMAVMVEKNVMLYILFFIVIVAAFGITCTLITFVVLKTREIGVMKALGATSRQIMWIFLSQSMVVSTLGVLAGLAAGVLLVTYRNPFLHLMRSLTGLELFPADIYGFTELPAMIVPGDLMVICGGSFIICLLAAAFPAWHASRLKPVEALRHE